MDSIWCVHLHYEYGDSVYDENVRIFLSADEALNFCYKMLKFKDVYESEGEPDYMTLWRYDQDDNGGYAALPEAPLTSWMDLNKRTYF